MDIDRVFVIGCGDVGTKLAYSWQARGAQVAALARSDASVQRLQESDIEPVLGDLDDVWTLRRLDLSGALVYYLAPPQGEGQNDLRVRTLVNALKTGRTPTKIVLISTTGVYGDCRGEWIDESAPTRPGTDRARRRLDSENVMRHWGRMHGVPIVVLRVAGIYGPERLPIERLQSGEPMVSEEQCPYTNRIHIDDLVQVCMAAAERGKPDSTYNVSDGQPSTMTAYFNAVADALALPRPPIISLEQASTSLSPGMLSYLSESRRLHNTKMREELVVILKYPDLKTGLAAIA